MKQKESLIHTLNQHAMNKIPVLIVMAAMLFTLKQESQAAEQFSDALTSGHYELILRYRYEFVEDDAFDLDANASTLKTRFNYSTAPYHGFTFFFEVDNVTEIFGDNYNSGAGTTPNRTQYPVVADPTGTELNQAWLNFNFSEHDFKLGRQRIIHDNQRFIGGVAWRQNEQTFDAANFEFNLAGSQLLITYIDEVHRIFGNDVPAGNHDNNTVLLNWSKTWQGQHRLVFFYYDIDNEDVSSFSTQTYGLSFETFVPIQNSLLSLGIDVARQSDAANNPVDFDADYWRLEVALETQYVDIILGREVLTGNAQIAGAAFRTPLATLHAFNGWSDRFLATPDSGLQDTFIGMIGSYQDFSWYLRYHDFESEATNQKWGYEWDAAVTYQINQHLSAQLKSANYESSGFRTDIRHLWFVINYDF